MSGYSKRDNRNGNRPEIRPKVTVKYQGKTFVDVESKEGASVKLKWKPKTDVSGYKVYMYSKSSGEYELVKTLRGADNSSTTISKTPTKPTLKTDTFDFKIYPYTIVDSQTTVIGDAIEVTV